MIKSFYRKKDKHLQKEKSPLLMMSLPALIKLFSVLDANTLEVMLLGVVNKIDKNEEMTIYVIDDWEVPPQTQNSAAYVTTNDDKYPNWLIDLPRETRQKMRCHFHSHPSMGVTPSGTDETTLAERLETIDDYYIRIIGNKKREFNIDFFDIENHKQYTEQNILCQIADHMYLDLTSTGTFIRMTTWKEMNTLVESRMRKYIYTASSYEGRNAYGYDYEDREAYADRPYYGVSHYGGKKETKIETKQEKLDLKKYYEEQKEELKLAFEEAQYNEEEKFFEIMIQFLLDNTKTSVTELETKCILKIIEDITEPGHLFFIARSINLTPTYAGFTSMLKLTAKEIKELIDTEKNSCERGVSR